tara:strand:- start:98 stop:220 length:123 start_codon:yes stop_codon:yes gene_type:complete
MLALEFVPATLTICLSLSCGLPNFLSRLKVLSRDKSILRL